MVLPVHLVVSFSFSFFFFFHHVLALSSASGECPAFFDCGNLGRLRFPLTTPQRKDCGMLQIHGCEHPDAEKTVYFGKKKFQVTRIYPLFWNRVFIRDADLEKRLVTDSCDAFRWNITLPRSSALGSLHILPNITMYKCNSSLKFSLSNQFLNYTGCGKSNNETIFFRKQDRDDPPPPLATCPKVQLPVNKLAFSADPFTFISSEFSVHIQLSPDCNQCRFERGLCRLNGTGGVSCSKFKEYQNKRQAWKLGLITGFGVGLGIPILALVLCFGVYKQKQSALSHVRLRSTDQNPNDEVGELAFQCLQIDKEMRPFIDDVLEVLRKIESENEDGGDVQEDKAAPNAISYDPAKLFKSSSSPNRVTVKCSSESTTNSSV